jgi:hypothetical protein
LPATHPDRPAFALYEYEIKLGRFFKRVHWDIATGQFPLILLVDPNSTPFMPSKKLLSKLETTW